jgi:hypothetical protein
VHVLPGNLGPIIKHLDPALFDLTTLVQDGYDDADSAPASRNVSPNLVQIGASTAWKAGDTEPFPVRSGHGVKLRSGETPKSVVVVRQGG